MTTPKVFVVGCARSGTTWVRAVLQHHPDVVGGIESHLFPVLHAALTRRRPGRAWRRSVLAQYDARAAVADESFGGTGPHRWIDRPRLVTLLDQAISERDDRTTAARRVIGGALDARVERSGNRPGTVLVEKTPRHLHYTAQILTWWPEARIVEVVRDGRDVCVSLEHKSRVEHWAPAERQEQIRRWCSAVHQGFAGRRDPNAAGRWHTVRYEDLSADPEGEIRRLYEFAGLDHDDALVAAAAEATSFERAQRPGNEDHVRAGRVAGWRDHFSAEDERLFRDMAGDLLQVLGYPV